MATTSLGGRMCQLVSPPAGEGAGRILTVTSVGGVVAGHSTTRTAPRNSRSRASWSRSHQWPPPSGSPCRSSNRAVATAFVDTVTKGYRRLGEPSVTPRSKTPSPRHWCLCRAREPTFSTAQSAEEVAAVIAAVATDPARLRYQTSECPAVRGAETRRPDGWRALDHQRVVRRPEAPRASDSQRVERALRKTADASTGRPRSPRATPPPSVAARRPVTDGTHEQRSANPRVRGHSRCDAASGRWGSGSPRKEVNTARATG